MIAAVETELEPPPALDEPTADEAHGDREVAVTVWITEADGTRRTAWFAQPEPDVDELAEMLCSCLNAAARLWGPALEEAIDRRLR